MSASPGAYATSLPQQTWIKVGRGQLIWYVSGTFTSNTTYQTVPPWYELPGSNGFGVGLIVVVTSVSGTSPSMGVSIYFTNIESFINGSPVWYEWLSISNITNVSCTPTGSNTLNSPVAFQIVIGVSGTSPSFTAYIELAISG
mgnify:CR=1 FL=1